MVIPRSFFGMLLMGTAAPLTIASAVMPTNVDLAPRQQATTNQPTATATYNQDEYLECSTLMIDLGEKLMPTPPPALPNWWFTHPLVQEMMETMTRDAFSDTTLGPGAIKAVCSAEFWRDTKLIPNEKEDGKEFVQEFKSWTEHTKEMKSKYRSSAYSLAAKCVHIGTLAGDSDVQWQAGALLSAVATNEQECATAASLMLSLTTLDEAATPGAATTTPTAGSGGDAAAASTSTAGAWRGRETGAAVAVVAGIVGAVVGF
ncbi:hypothetical protein B0T21DRAFT_353574 [Apiosordaria backusii]|uniref:Uncharacterized protein n=1 Tax=Apiosordaria backusii TaxID=314023 RepID=A0AA39ZRR2_9PEZI|nr:hypothetical protein B0T21DRAFT_353574 [Apiosordaria backusii]